MVDDGFNGGEVNDGLAWQFLATVGVFLGQIEPIEGNVAFAARQGH